MVFPWPDARLNPNKRFDRRALIAIKAAQKREWWTLALAQGLRGGNHLRLTFCPPDHRRRDRDNLLASIKSGLDGLALALGVDDSEWDLTVRRGAPRPGGAVLVEFGFVDDVVPRRGRSR